MFEEVEARRQSLDRHRPFDDATLRRLDALFEPWFIYSSNALEGNTLTYGDTVYLIREKRLPAGKSEEEYLEVKGQQDAYAYLQEAAAGKFQLSEKLIKEFHTLLTRNLSDPAKYGPGKYKSRDNQVHLGGGTFFPYVSALSTPGAMRDLVDWYLGPGQQLHPIERAAALHYKFILIHPFLDGNGRTARLLANLSLLQAGFVIAVFRMQEQHDRRRVYLDALRAVDGSVPFEDLAPDNPKLNTFPLVTYLEQELLWSYDQALDVVEGRGATTAEDLVRRFEKLEDRALAAQGLGADEAARAVLLAERIPEAIRFLVRRTDGLVVPLAKKWSDLDVQVNNRIESPEFLTRFERSSRPPRLGALGLPARPVAGRVGLIWLAIGKRNGSPSSMIVPYNLLELVIFAEPHRLILASIFGVRPSLQSGERWISDRLDLPLDLALWREAEIDDFLARQIGRYLEGVEGGIVEMNRPPSSS